MKTSYKPIKGKEGARKLTLMCKSKFQRKTVKELRKSVELQNYQLEHQEVNGSHIAEAWLGEF